MIFLRKISDAALRLFLHLAQAAHWFQWDVLWPRLARLVRPGGTVAVWVSAPIFMIITLSFMKFTSLSIQGVHIFPYP